MLEFRSSVGSSFDGTLVALLLFLVEFVEFVDSFVLADELDDFTGDLLPAPVSLVVGVLFVRSGTLLLFRWKADVFRKLLFNDDEVFNVIELLLIDESFTVAGVDVPVNLPLLSLLFGFFLFT